MDWYHLVGHDWAWLGLGGLGGLRGLVRKEALSPLGDLGSEGPWDAAGLCLK